MKKTNADRLKKASRSLQEMQERIAPFTEKRREATPPPPQWQDTQQVTRQAKQPVPTP